MNLDTVERAIAAADTGSIQQLLEDDETVFWVDRNEEDDAIADYCEAILKTGKLSSELVDTDEEDELKLYVKYGKRRMKVPLAGEPADRHITILSLNRVLAPDYEIRFCIDSAGSDTIAFMPLPAAEWKRLEEKYASAVTKRFYMIRNKPNLFADKVDFKD